MRYSGVFAEPKVTLIARTALTEDFPDDRMPLQGESTDAESLVTFAGRLCYQSHHRPSEATRRDADYIERTVFGQGHGSVVEHATATFLLEGVSRSFLAELTRHRHLSFSVQSQRFVNESESQPVLPPAMEDDSGLEWTLKNIHEQLTESYDLLVEILQRDAGLPRKQAREAARAVLPNMTSTSIVVSGNLRSWIEFLEKRLDPSADREIQVIARKIQAELKHEVSPVIFGRFDNDVDV